MISTTSLVMQFGEKPLFENVSVKFGDATKNINDIIQFLCDIIY